MAPQQEPAGFGDRRVQQTLELQRIIEAKGKGQYSPRSKRLISELSPVLEAYGYGEADIYNLLKRCGFEENRIQAAVSNILEEKSGHEQGEWKKEDTASERKAKAVEARERREQRK